MSEPKTFLDYLEAFNRKERFFLVAEATGTMHPGKAAFRLSPEFRTRLGQEVGLTIPDDAMGFMDYHLDWLHAAAVLTMEGKGWPTAGLKQPDENRVAGGNQEDVDLLVAYLDGDVVNVVLIEAKAESSWTTKQVSSKVGRLTRIFGAAGNAVPGVVPKVCLMSPRPSRGLGTLPSWWMKGNEPMWLRLAAPAGRRQVHRSDELGAFASSQNHWAVRSVDHLYKASDERRT